VEIGDSPDGWTFDLRRGNNPAVLCAVAKAGCEASELWDGLEKLYFSFSEQFPEFAQDGMNAYPEKPDSGPWLATLLFPGIASAAPADIGWMADFERCLAWALLESE
jgi:hypothetical protein